jgi:hypothetical protein
MSKVVGHGGYWVVDTGIPGPLTIVGTLKYIVHNARYEFLVSADLRETRAVGCGGYAEGLPRFLRLEYAKFLVAEDDESYPQVLGFKTGREISFYMKRGALGEFTYVYRSIVQSVRVENDQQKARWVEVVCKYGRVFDSVPSPETGLPPFPPPATLPPGGHTIPVDTTGTGPQFDQYQQVLQQNQ